MKVMLSLVSHSREKRVYDAKVGMNLIAQVAFGLGVGDFTHHPMPLSDGR